MERRSLSILLDSTLRLYRTVWFLVAIGLLAGGALAWQVRRQDWQRDVTSRSDRLALAIGDFRRAPPEDRMWFTVRNGRVVEASTGWAWLPTYDICAESAFAQAHTLAPGDWTLVGSTDPDSGRDRIYLVTGGTDSWRADVLPMHLLDAALGTDGSLQGRDDIPLRSNADGTTLLLSARRGIPGARDLHLVVQRRILGAIDLALVSLVLAWIILGNLPARQLARSIREMHEERDLLARAVASLIEESGDRTETPRLQALRHMGERYLASCQQLQPRWEEHRQQSLQLASLLKNIIALVDKLERQQSDRLRAVGELSVTMDCIAEAVVTTDNDLRIRSMNPAAELLAGRSSTAARGQPLAEVLRVDGDDPVVLCQVAGEAIAAQRPLAMEDAVRIVGREGVGRNVVGSCAPLRDGDRVSGAVITLHDITELLSLQEQLHHAQKLEAIGHLAGGVAHDFNNLLTAISGHAEALRRDATAMPDLQQRAARIISTARQAAELTGRLLSFSRKQDQRHEPTDVHHVIREAVDLLRQSLPTLVEIETRLLAHHPGIIGNRGNLLNAFINLGINARDAMPGEGRLIFATRNITANHEHSPQIDPGTPCLEISVCDSGCGMPPEVLARIFEPFFTTKEAGKGTGLGLSTTANLIAACGGTITANSTPGIGTTFCLTLPTCEQTFFHHTRSTSCEAVTRTGHILVVDDETSIADLVEDILLDHGFTCEIAHDGRTAVDRYRDDGPFDLVMMDVTMPRMNGIDAFRAIRKLDPRARVILCTGYGEITDAGQLYREGLSGFIVKPFHPNRLIKTLCASLDKSDSDTGRIERHESTVS